MASAAAPAIKLAAARCVVCMVMGCLLRLCVARARWSVDVRSGTGGFGDGRLPVVAGGRRGETGGVAIPPQGGRERIVQGGGVVAERGAELAVVDYPAVGEL